MKLTDEEMSRIEKMCIRRISHRDEQRKGYTPENLAATRNEWRDIVGKIQAGIDLDREDWGYVLFALRRDGGEITHSCFRAPNVMWPRTKSDLEKLNGTWSLMAKILEGLV